MSSSELHTAKFFRIGLFGKLQQLMQSEKERDMDFLKNLDSGASISGQATVFYLSIFWNNVN